MNWLDWNGNFDDPNDSEDDWEADNESIMEQHNGVDNPETPVQQNVSATQSIPWLIQSTRRLKNIAENVLMTVNTMAMRRNKVIKTK